MPRKSTINSAELISVLKQFTEQIRETPIPSDPIWPVISNELLLRDVIISARHCYTIVKQNRYNIRHHLGLSADEIKVLVRH
ncbi:hypothetical protein V9T40_001252 [Parthenolecanium corni]|uniref:Uncharacterized protein n=1 Tax=Parthenolecanium corni TaxID=536013 RepID=A0AAN9TEY5_9HEMI